MGYYPVCQIEGYDRKILHRNGKGKDSLISNQIQAIACGNLHSELLSSRFTVLKLIVNHFGRCQHLSVDA